MTRTARTQTNLSLNIIFICKNDRRRGQEKLTSLNSSKIKVGLFKQIIHNLRSHTRRAARISTQHSNQWVFTTLARGEGCGNFPKKRENFPSFAINSIRSDGTLPLRDGRTHTFICVRWASAENPPWELQFPRGI